MPGSIVSAKAMHKSLTSKYKTVRNVSVDIMYLFYTSIINGMNRSRPLKSKIEKLINKIIVLHLIVESLFKLI